MGAPSSEETSWRLELANEQRTRDLAVLIADFLGPEDLVTLSGDLGAGKTTFARAMIRHLTGDPDLEVPSPTFTLMQVYATRLCPIVHADLYRVTRAAELTELGWDEAAEGAIVLVEWAQRAQSALAPDRLDIALTLDPAAGEDVRVLTLTGYGVFASRLTHMRSLTELLRQSGWEGAQRTFMAGDASTRAYERLTNADGRTAILMISPKRADGPPIRFGKSYSAIARLAEDIRPFLVIDEALRGAGLSAPEIYAADRAAGLAILEDFGAREFLENGRPAPERYGEAVALLARLHARPRADVLPDGAGGAYTIPPYDSEALSIEVELLLDWYAPHIARAAISSGAKAMFINAWRRLFDEVLAGEKTWTLRDYHSPNIIWLDERDGPLRVGLLDFQDCVMGHAAYDVASLLQDARVNIPDEWELRLLSLYASLRHKADPHFDTAGFARAYAILGAQRATKILGIFARLDKRDRKSQYLAHIPRIQSYLGRGLAHPALSDIRLWYETHLPRVLAPGG